jgi:hypothetical protein
MSANPKLPDLLVNCIVPGCIVVEHCRSIERFGKGCIFMYWGQDLDASSAGVQGSRDGGVGEQRRNEDYSGWHNGKTVLESGGQRVLDVANLQQAHSIR